MKMKQNNCHKRLENVKKFQIAGKSIYLQTTLVLIYQTRFNSSIFSTQPIPNLPLSLGLLT